MMLLSRAVHNLPWGTLESEEVLVEVKEPLAVDVDHGHEAVQAPLVESQGGQLLGHCSRKCSSQPCRGSTTLCTLLGHRRGGIPPLSG